jgi:mono/diheme cytochrome c family protein
MTRRSNSALLASCAVIGALSLSLSARAESRGELLYSTHCIECHTSQMHWRDKKLATDWDSLKAQVQRWQASATLGWNEQDVVEVTRYLNDTFYRFPRNSGSRSAAASPPSGAWLTRSVER